MTLLTSEDDLWAALIDSSLSISYDGSKVRGKAWADLSNYTEVII